MIPDPTIAVIGAGAWGTALAVLGARAGRRTYLWTANTAAAARLAAARCNEARLPGIAFLASAEQAGVERRRFARFQTERRLGLLPGNFG